MKKLINALMDNHDLNLKIKEIFNLEKSIKMKLTDYPQLQWTILQYRSFLEQEFIKIINNLKLPNYIMNLINFKINEKIDLILPPLIGDYFSKNWIDTTLVASVFLKRIKINYKTKNWGWIYINCVLNQNNEKNIIINNKKILDNTDSIQEFIENLQNRVIFSSFGGIENIDNIDIVKYRFNINGLPSNENNLNYVERQYLRINIKDNSKLNEYNNLLWYCANDFLFYKKYFKNTILGSSILNFDTDNIAFEKSIDTIANEQKENNNYLILINNFEENRDIINNLINNWKYKNSPQLKDKCINIIIKNTYEHLLDNFISQFEEIVTWLSTNYMQLCILKSKVRRTIKTEIKKTNINIIDYNNFEAELFNKVMNIVEEVE